MVLFQSSCIMLHQRKCVALDNPVTIIYGQHDSVEAAKTEDDVTVENDTEDEEFLDDFDPSSDEEIEETADERVPMPQVEIGSSVS